MPPQEPGQRLACRRALLLGAPRRLVGEMPPHPVQAGVERVEIGSGPPGRDLVRERMHNLAEAHVGVARGLRMCLVLKEPAHRAGRQTGQRRPRQPDGGAHRDHRYLTSGHLGQPPPAARTGGRHQRAARVVNRGRKPREPGRGGLPHRRCGGRVDGGPAQRRNRRRQCQGTRQPGTLRGHRHSERLRVAQFAEEPARAHTLIISGVDSCDDEPAPCPGQRDIEQPAFVREKFGAGRGLPHPAELGTVQPFGLQQ